MFVVERRMSHDIQRITRGATAPLAEARAFTQAAAEVPGPVMVGHHAAEVENDPLEARLRAFGVGMRFHDGFLVELTKARG